jgi:hypothetical protein
MLQNQRVIGIGTYYMGDPHLSLVDSFQTRINHFSWDHLQHKLHWD